MLSMDVYDEQYQSAKEKLELNDDELHAIITEAMEQEAVKNPWDSHSKLLVVTHIEL